MTGSVLKTPFTLGAYPNAPDGSNAGNEANFQTDFNSFTALMGTAPSYLDYYTDYTQPVTSWVSNASWQAWSAAQTPSAAATMPVISLPMYSIAAGALSPDLQYQAIIAGQDDSVITGIVDAWAAQGFKTLAFRPGWEMNLQGYTYAGDSAQSQADWVAAFQHIYTVLHQAAAAAGVTVTVIWNPGTTNYSNAGAITNLYPGNAYVDAIGADVYADINPYSDTTSGAPLYHDWDTGGEDTSTAQFITDPINRAHYWSYPAATEWSNDSSGGHSLSLTALLQFAAQQGKTFVIPETGAGNSNSGNDVADDAAFPQWLAQQLTTAQAAGTKIGFVNVWDSNGGGNYEFSNTSDNKPLEAAAWAKYFGVQPATTATTPAITTPTPTSPATITLGSGSDIVSLQLAEDAWQGDAQVTLSVDGMQIGGAQTITASHAAGQSQVINLEGNWGAGQHTVTVAFINDAYGGSPSTDRNAYVLSVSYDLQAAAIGSAALLSNGAVNFTAGTPVANAATTLGLGADTVDLQISEDAWQGNAQFTVSVDGVQVAGTQIATAIHTSGQDQDFLIEGNWGSGQHTVTVNFLNDGYGGSPAMDRNLYVDAASYDGQDPTGASLSLLNNGPQSLVVGTPISASGIVGTGSETIDLKMSEDAYNGNGQFTITVDGTQIGGTQTVQALHSTGSDEDFLVEGNWGAGSHTVAINFLNDLYGGSPSKDRNIYLDSATFNGAPQAAAMLTLLSTGTQSFQASLPDTLVLHMAEDAWAGDAMFTVSVDGKQEGTTQTVTASHAAGQSQDFTLGGNWGQGAHTVTVNFLNDAWGGTAAMDRNLYVNGITLDSTSFTENAPLWTTGSQSFNVTTSKAYTLGSAGGAVTTLGNDTVTVGSGAATVSASGPSVQVTGGAGALTFIAHGGNDTVTAGSGAVTLTGSTGTLTFTEGSGAATVTLSTGKGVFDFLSSHAGGSLVVNDFTPGFDVLHLQGYQGSGISSEQVTSGSTHIVLTDNTQITLTGVSDPYTHSVFG